jgi:hypothetical protein
LRLVTFSDGASERLGAAIEGQRILDLADAHQIMRGRQDARLSSMQALIEGGADALAIARALEVDHPAESVKPQGSVRLLAPIPIPVQMRDFMLFEQHATNSGKRKVPVIRARSWDRARSAVDAAMSSVVICKRATPWSLGSSTSEFCEIGLLETRG